MEIDHKIISSPSIDSRRVIVSYLQKYITKYWLTAQRTKFVHARLDSEVGSVFDCRSRGRKFESTLDHITVMKIDHEIISVVIIPIPLIQGEQLSGTGAKKKKKKNKEINKDLLFI